jgi:hypothetical protein
MKKMKLWQIASIAVLAMGIFGCGGSGGSSDPGTGGAGTSNLDLFVTDNMVEGYDNVWVTIRKVELVSASGNRTVFDDAEGKTIDVRSLRDSAGQRFRLLGRCAIANGDYTGLQVTVSENVSVVPTGAEAAVEATFEGSVAGQKAMTVNFPSVENIRRPRQLVVDFDLPNWTLTGTTVSATNDAYLAIVRDPILGDLGRHDRDEYRGTVSNLVGEAPTQTFTLTRGVNTMTVRTDGDTVIFNANGAPSPVLANGQRVEVYGAFSTTDNSLLANRVKIQGELEEASRLKGRIDSFSSENNTMVVRVLDRDGFRPATTTVNVAYGLTTRFFGVRGVALTEAEFEEGLVQGHFIKAEGSFAEGTFNAEALKLEPGEGAIVGAVKVAGTPGEANAEAGTFSIRADEWHGLFIRRDQPVQVKLGEEAELKVGDNRVTQADFFAALSNSARVSVTGRFDPATRVVTAHWAHVRTGANN